MISNRTADTEEDSEEWIIVVRKKREASTGHILRAFKKKDLICGLNEGYRDQIIDILDKRNKYPYIYANHLNSPTVDLVVENSTDTSTLNKSQKKYYHFLKTQRDYLMRPNGKPVPTMQDDPVAGAAYRRACKLLALSANTEERVHFELAGIDIARVCKKNDLGVTNSELRSLYRDSKENGKNPYLFFYMNGKPCPPPWEQAKHKKHWESYDRKREEKKEESKKMKPL